MTDATAIWISLIAASPPTVAIILGRLQSRREHRQSVGQADVMDGKLDQIHQLTNSTLTAANRRIEVLEREIAAIKGTPLK
jgi:hypothetical protein